MTESEQQGKVGEDPSQTTIKRDRTPTPDNQSVNYQIGLLKVRQGNFGIASGVEKGPRKIAGRKKAADIVAELSWYVEPDGFAAGVKQLDETHVAVLTGRAGIGKSTAGLALLHDIAPGDQIHLPPTATLEDLCLVKYRPGVGYLLANHAVRDNNSETEFRWETMRDRVRHAGAYLVITTVHAAPIAADSLDWCRPDLVAVLDKRLVGLNDATGLVRELAEQIPNDWTLASVAECARVVLADPGATQKALEVFDQAIVTEVQDWFNDESRGWQDTIEAAALVFCEGSSSRQFESYVADLSTALEEYLPAADTTDEAKAKIAAEARMRQRRHRAGGLIHLERVEYGGVWRQVLAFSSEKHRLYVLEELWNSYRTPFWNGVRDWLDDLLDSGDLSSEELLQISQGVALLARVNLEEAGTSYLQPWAAGHRHVQGMTCAAGALRLMSFDDDLAPIALQIAVDWVNYGTPSERITACEALSSELGMVYPAEAARRLWQLLTQDVRIAVVAELGPAHLLMNLAQVDGDPSELLAMLERQVRRLRRPRTEIRTIDLTLGTVLMTLGFEVPYTKRLVSFDLLAARPDCAGPLARLWAGVLGNRRFRVDALGAIWEGLRRSPERTRVGQLLGDALATAVPVDEHRLFIRDFRTIDSRKRLKDKSHAESLAYLIVDAIERINRRSGSQEA